MSQILLIDLNDFRRETRVRVLQSAGHFVTVFSGFVEVEKIIDEEKFDAVLVSVSDDQIGNKAIAYSDRLARRLPNLPVLLLTDYGVFLPVATLSPRLETGHPAELLTWLREITKLLVVHEG